MLSYLAIMIAHHRGQCYSTRLRDLLPLRLLSFGPTLSIVGSHVVITTRRLEQMILFLFKSIKVSSLYFEVFTHRFNVDQILATSVRPFISGRSISHSSLRTA